MATSIPAASRRAVESRDAYHCVRCGIPTMHGQWHHRRSRSIRDEHQHCPCNGIWLCASCHKWVHEHPFEARSRGWIVSRSKMPNAEPVQNMRFGWVMLTCSGQRVGREPPEHA